MKHNFIIFTISALLLAPVAFAQNTHGRAPYTAYSEADVDSLDTQTTDGIMEETERIADEPILPPTVTDSIYIARLRRLHSVMDLPFNSIVRGYIKAYTEKSPERAARLLGLSEYYFPIFDPILDKYGMPLEFKYLAVIESALNPRARSRVGATGLWQFMFATGRMYGLNLTSCVDDRCDPIKATDAAARHLRDLYNIYNDWSLAMAAYNCGAGNVNKAIYRSGKHDFWGIYNYLPRETRGYVPAFIGAAYMMNYAKEHGIKPAKYDYRRYMDYDTVTVTQWLHFDQIAATVGVSVDELRDLNPQYRRDIVPGNERPYSLKLPTRHIKMYIDSEKNIAQYKADEYNPKTMIAPAEFEEYTPTGKTKIVYKVKSGDNLGSIAGRYNVRVQDLKQWNALRNNRLRAGQNLKIYLKPSKAQQLSAKNSKSVATNKTTSAAATSPATSTATATTSTTSAAAATDNAAKPNDTTTKNGYLYYKVKKGDTMWSISQQFKYLGVTLENIRALNGMDSSTKVQAGQAIKIKKIG